MAVRELPEQRTMNAYRLVKAWTMAGFGTPFGGKPSGNSPGGTGIGFLHVHVRPQAGSDGDVFVLFPSSNVMHAK